MQKSMKLTKIFLAMSTALAAIGSVPVFAEEKPESAEADQAPEVILVTGSRIVRKDYASASPVATIGSDQLESFGAVTVEESLNSLPQFIAGNSSSTLAIGGGGGATLNLRALGPTRNLVLMDQRRMPTSTAFGEVDVDSIPSIALKNAEVLTGGASSVYGSEAISGVVNFQTVDYFDGIKYKFGYGTSSEGDGDRTDLNILLGSEGDKARGIFALSSSDRRRVFGADRDWRLFSGQSTFLGAGTYRIDGNPINLDALNNLFTSQYGTSGGITSPDRIGFNSDGTLFTQGVGDAPTLNYKGPTGVDTLYHIGNDGSVRMPVGGRQGDLVKPLDRTSLFAKGEYDVNDETTLYTQAIYSSTQTIDSVSRNLTVGGPTITVSVDNQFIPDDLRTLLATRDDPNAPFILNKRFTSLPERAHVQDFTSTQFLVGLKGYLGYSDWSYDTYFSKDTVDSTETVDVQVLASRVNALTNAADGGASICAGGYNPFGDTNENSLSQECKDFISPGTLNSLKTDRNLWEGTITGSLFEVPAGDVQFSLTLSWREESLKTTKDISVSTNDALGVSVSTSSEGTTETREIGGELLVPIVDDLNATFGYRVSDQDVTGNADSWSIGLEWAAMEELFLRASLQQAVRAPNVGELFNSPVGGEVTVGDPINDPNSGDPCDIRTSFRTGSDAAGVRAICLAQGMPAALVDSFQHSTVSIPALVGGNTELDPETADTLTLGAVWQPEIKDHDLAITFDYWQIEIEDVINPVTGRDVLQRCYNSVFNPTLDPNNEFCQLISRDPAQGIVQSVNTTFLNLAALETAGFDLQINHAIDLGPGRLNTNIFAGYLLNYDEQNLPGEAFVDTAGTVGGTANRSANNDFHPELKFVLSPTYAWDDFSLGLRWRYTSSVDDRSTAFDPTSTSEGIGSYDLYDLKFTYELSENIIIDASINNLADEEPPEFGGEGNTRFGSYDVIGRYFSIGVQGSF